MGAPIHEPNTVIERPKTLALCDDSLTPTNTPAYESEDVRDPQIEWRLDFERRYQRRDSLGRGGMGEIGCFHDHSIGRDVAVKLLHESYQTCPDLRARFLREACLQGQLEHPSIVPVHDVGLTSDGRPFFTMKRIRGMTLTTVLEGLRKNERSIVDRFSRRKLLTAFSNVCMTIAFAHDKGVVHRDMKPSNIMLGDFGETYVIDWGVAKLMGDMERSDIEAYGETVVPTRAGAVIGTPGYMAPEQIGGAPEDVRPRADIYALGAILFEILTLERMHLGACRDDLIRSTLETSEGRPSKRNPETEVPTALDDICAKATSFVPEKRFATVKEMHDALERFLDGDGDLSRRRELAAKHAEAADRAILAARTGPANDEEGNRSDAMLDVGRALALDPENKSAMKSLLELLLEPPRRFPNEAEAEIDRMRKRAGRSLERRGAFAWAMSFIGVPLLFWMGVRDWSLVIATCFAMTATLLMGVWSSRHEETPRWLLHTRIALMALTIALGARTFGPLVVAPTYFAVVTLLVALRPDISLWGSATVSSAIGMIAPLALERFGVLQPSYAFMNGMMCIVPNAVELRPTATMVWLMFVGLGIVLLAGRVGEDLRRAAHKRELAAYLYAWHLRQLIPKQLVRPRSPRAS